MNKQELIERLNNKLDETFAFQQSFKPLTWAHMECESKANAYMTAINYVEQLDEPQKVKVPELPSKIAKYLEWAKEEQFDFTEDYNMISWEDLRKFGGDDTEYLQMWFFDNDQKENERRHILFLQAYTDGYEVDEERKRWVVKKSADSYFKAFNGIDFRSSSVAYEDYACLFADRKKAEAVALLVDGSVEKV
ncbi:hypothetical protein [Enterococcus dongliensis]|uniref:hypothetical protein n=1 Tax=Enterococcus dongliensis TaxID=2559925 RepID=UPI00288D3A4F|nr:hypothetical protein [Enterococcus dongliensis]MDT2675031.1 hypothetical protein [Enterococcus dongliensis]